MRTTPVSVLRGAAPKPGKCLAVAETPPSRSPRAKAAPKRAAAGAVKPKPRPSACGALSGRTTSTTGARSTFMPAARRVAAVARPSARATEGVPVAPICGALRVGAPGSRFTLPPSWSTMSSSGARSPGGRGIGLQPPRERADLRRRPDVGAQEDHAGGLAAADARQQRRRRHAPGEREDDVLAGELRGRQRGRPARRRRLRVALRIRAGRLVLAATPGEQERGDGERDGAAAHRAKLVSAVRR